MNDPVNCRFSVTLNNLEPDTSYQYRVGSGEKWSDFYEFRTAPQRQAAFSFTYWGDIQEGVPETVAALNSLLSKHPQAAFCMIGGDFLGEGSDRNAWDELFSSSTIFNYKFLAPAVGNHDLDPMEPGQPLIYFAYFALPANGPSTLPQGHAYSFTYGNAYFIVLDSECKVAIENQ